MGKPKGLLKIGDVPILQWILDRMHWPGPTLLVTAPGREHPPGSHRFAREVTDPVAGEGPLRGIITALEASQTARTIILPVDMPFMAPQHLRWLASHNCAGALFLRRMRGGQDQIEPMPLLADRSVLPRLQARLRSGHASVRSLASETGFSVIIAPADWEDRVWTNLNYPKDMIALA